MRESVWLCESVRIFLPPIDLTTTPKFFNNKEKGDRIRDQKIIIHIPSHLKHTYTDTHARIFRKFYNYIYVHVFGLHTY